MRVHSASRQWQRSFHFQVRRAIINYGIHGDGRRAVAPCARRGACDVHVQMFKRSNVQYIINRLSGAAVRAQWRQLLAALADAAPRGRPHGHQNAVAAHNPRENEKVERCTIAERSVREQRGRAPAMSIHFGGCDRERTHSVSNRDRDSPHCHGCLNAQCGCAACVAAAPFTVRGRRHARKKCGMRVHFALRYWQPLFALFAFDGLL